MGWYSTHILPRCVHWGMRGRQFREQRPRCVGRLSGRVLELGFGSGNNLPFYSSNVTEVLAVEPSLIARKLARENLASSTIPVEYVGLVGEELPVDSASVDCVVSTWTLCTIPDVQQALREAKRVLHDDGRLHFLEHGRSRDPGVLKWQHRLDPIQGVWAGGCKLSRAIDEIVLEAGFELEELEEYYMQGPKFVSYMYRGIASKAE